MFLFDVDIFNIPHFYFLQYLQVPVVYARKERNVVMADTFSASFSSKTVGKNRELLVSKNHLHPKDRVLIVDDFLSSGASQEALLRIVGDSQATAVGVGVLLEKGTDEYVLMMMNDPQRRIFSYSLLVYCSFN